MVTNVSVIPTGGGNSSYHAAACPLESMVRAWMGESAPASPKLWTLEFTGVPAPVAGSIVIKPWKAVSPMAVVAYSVSVVGSQANPLTVKPIGPITATRAPLLGSICTKLLVSVQGPPGTTFLHDPVVPRRMGLPGGGVCADAWGKARATTASIVMRIID